MATSSCDSIAYHDAITAVHLLKRPTSAHTQGDSIISKCWYQ